MSPSERWQRSGADRSRSANSGGATIAQDAKCFSPDQRPVRPGVRGVQAGVSAHRQPPLVPAWLAVPVDQTFVDLVTSIPGGVAAASDEVQPLATAAVDV